MKMVLMGHGTKQQAKKINHNGTIIMRFKLFKERHVGWSHCELL